MKVVDIHPEELIDKLHAGSLSASERERLDLHLAQCSACRFEISVRDDFEQDAPELEARPQLSFGERERKPLSAPPVVAPVRTRRRRWPLIALVAAFVLCAGGATAAVVAGAVPAARWLPWAPPAQPSESSAATAKAKPKAKVVAVAPTTAPSVAELSVAFEPVASAAPESLPASAKAPPVRAVAPLALVATRTSASAVVESAAAESSAPTRSDTTPRVDPAAALFADANRARRDGNAERAVGLYRSLQSRFPSSAESELSRALLAQLLLERGNPEAALAGFDRYLAEGAPVLGAEALVGRARALEQLGKPAQAITAWQAVQSRFPGSVHARLAATRLAALGER